MSFNITFQGHSNYHGSDNSSYTDEEASSEAEVSHPSDPEDAYGGEDWNLPYPDELKPSDSASRPRISHRSRNQIHGSRSVSGRRQSSRRGIARERSTFSHRSRHHSPESPESVGSSDDYGGPFVPGAHERGPWPPVVPGPTSPYNVYQPGNVPPAPFAHLNGPLPSDQLVSLAHPNQTGQAPYGHFPYTYGSQFHHPNGSSMPPVFVHDHNPGQRGNLGRHINSQAASLHIRNEGHNPLQQRLPHNAPPTGSPYGLPPFGARELVPYGPGNHYNLRDPYPAVPGMVPTYFGNYSPPSPKAEHTPPPQPPPPPAAAETPKDEAIERLEKLILEERMAREARQAAIEKAAAEKAAKEERAAHEKQIADVAAALARADAEKKAAEEAAKLKKEAEAAAAAAADKAKKEAEEAALAEAEKKAAEAAAQTKKEVEEAAAKAKKEAEEAAAAKASAPKKKKPIKFKDAIGRKFSFPFDLCCTWKGMEELIRQAFLHIEAIGPHVAEGRYDLVGPNGDIILPQVWETVIEPDWTITMHMWPIPEKPKPSEPDPPPADASKPQSGAGSGAAGGGAKKKPEQTGMKKQRPKAPDPGAFAMWMVGRDRFGTNKSSQKKKATK
ncbi:hypothetical protein MPDQ_005090 [Monascus purpureus]|uniref:Ubiquitin-like domain-containing protein n=1 Tax=Monascus purpureus TaxID=5098 RepID=A0A507QGL1_MONPU|nr:hypothetical protein MPDQ_005090 [Monascus purpureus]BDD56511.1 hypothetical protein MAP00_001959 [Monascus purpureus]